MASTTQRSTILALVEQCQIRAAYQPIVEIASARVVGYEALARGPAGSTLEMPAALFALAEEEEVLSEFDRACRRIALTEGLQAGLKPSDLLFVNVEPAALDADGILDPVFASDLSQVSIVVELTERALTAQPGEVLAAVRWLRQHNCRIALDDVGVDPRSLALMPFLSPDVIKLDASITRNEMPPLQAARILNAVQAEAERSGAALLAEGIETPDDLRRAESLGATLGQGWLFGHPGEIDPSILHRDEKATLPPRFPAVPADSAPFELIADSRALRRGDKKLLLSLSRQLEEEATNLQGEAIVLSTFQDAQYFTDQTRTRYERLAQSVALAGAIGVGMESEPGLGIRGASIDVRDPLRGEWDVAIVGPHFSAAFVARDLGDTGPDLERRFDYYITYDRPLVLAVARSLLQRILPAF